MTDFHTVLLVGTIIFLIIAIGAVWYYILVESPKEKQKYANQKHQLDLMTCAQLGDWVINNSLNSTYSDGGYTNPNYPYAQAKYIKCTHEMYMRNP